MVAVVVAVATVAEATVVEVVAAVVLAVEVLMMTRGRQRTVEMVLPCHL
jgi:uncharacterized membrane protein